jgi:hypothetical protein
MPECPYCNGTATHKGKGCPLRKRSGKKPPREIAALDCETVDGRIVLFLGSDERGQTGYLHDPSGLRADAILEWMVHVFAARLCIGFFFDYDVQQIVKQLPPAHLHQLRARGRVVWKRWRIRHVPGKRFSVTDTESGITCTIWDVSGWTQCSFVRLITDWRIGTEEERQFVAQMKARRNDLSGESLDDLIRYTTLECRLLCVWFRQMLALHERCGIKLQAYSGAGSTAAAMLRRAKWKPPEIPPDVQRAAEQAFFGGRSETSRIGPCAGPVYGYDINSAYPHALRLLPEIRNARWHRVRRWHEDMWGFYEVGWRQPADACWGSFPLRGARLPEGRRSISLLYPVTGQGIYHSDEVRAAMEAGVEVEVLRGWCIEPKGRPFAWIEETVEERLRMKQAGDSAQVVLKLGLNSLYGKLAQHAGSHPSQCMVYAAAITARTRAMLLPVLLRHGHDILLAATDGLLARVPLDLPVGVALGEWEISMHDSAWILQAGVYWAGDKIRTRGIDQRGLSLDEVRRIWKRQRCQGAIRLTARRVVSYRSACARGKPELTGCWIEQERIVRFDAAPRRRAWKWTDGALLTLPARTADYLMQATLDQITLDAADDLGYDDHEALPDWMFE